MPARKRRRDLFVLFWDVQILSETYKSRLLFVIRWPEDRDSQPDL